MMFVNSRNYFADHYGPLWGLLLLTCHKWSTKVFPTAKQQNKNQTHLYNQEIFIFYLSYFFGCCSFLRYWAHKQNASNVSFIWLIISVVHFLVFFGCNWQRALRLSHTCRMSQSMGEWCENHKENIWFLMTDKCVFSLFVELFFFLG